MTSKKYSEIEYASDIDQLLPVATLFGSKMYKVFTENLKTTLLSKYL